MNARTTALQTGEIDAMAFVDTTTADLLASAPGLKLIQTKGKQHYAFSMNCKDPLFTDPNVRMAMKLAIDRQEMLDKILPAVARSPTTSRFPRPTNTTTRTWNSTATTPKRPRRCWKRPGLRA